LVNRILFPYLNESLLLLEEGAPPRDIDKAATAFGMPMGPILLHDVVGIDTSLYAGQVIADAFADRAVMPKVVAELVKAGRMGLILGIGFPRFRGGLLRWADEQGLPKVLEKLAKYEHLGARFKPTDQMRQLAAAGRGFYS